MTYDEFLNIPVSALKDLETILILKDKYHMDITAEERELLEHISKFCEEQIKSDELWKQKKQLENLFKK
jgi:hypothetical protein